MFTQDVFEWSELSVPMQTILLCWLCYTGLLNECDSYIDFGSLYYHHSICVLVCMSHMATAIATVICQEDFSALTESGHVMYRYPIV